MGVDWLEWIAPSFNMFQRVFPRPKTFTLLCVTPADALLHRVSEREGYLFLDCFFVFFLYFFVFAGGFWLLFLCWLLVAFGFCFFVGLWWLLLAFGFWWLLAFVASGFCGFWLSWLSWLLWLLAFWPIHLSVYTNLFIYLSFFLFFGSCSPFSFCICFSCCFRCRDETKQGSKQASKQASTSCSPLDLVCCRGGAAPPPPTPPRHEICTSSPTPAPATKSIF